MNSFTISQLQDYSGIKAHTIRIWEQRYNALKPNRTEGNTRYYDGNQLRRLLNITSLLGKDYKISKLCAMPDEDLNQLIDTYFLQPDPKSGNQELYISQLLSATFDFDEARFEKLFSNCILRFGLKDTYSKVLHPTMIRLGILWSKDSLPPAHEHFIVNLIKQQVFAAVSAIQPAQDKAATWLLFLPEDEFHELGLLMAYFLVRNAGEKVYYFGANLPTESLRQSISQINPDNVLTFLVSKTNKDKTIDAIDTLSKEFEKIKFYAASKWSDSDIHDNSNSNFHRLSTIEELVSLFA